MLDEQRPDSVETFGTPAALPGQEGVNEVGMELQAARLRLGWALPDIAAALRIRPSYLEALEQGHPSELPAAAYALGFLRTYAAALGLDSGALANRFKAEAAELAHNTELAFPVPAPKRGVPAGAAVLVGLVLAVGAYAGWYTLSGEGRLPPETVPQLPERLAPLAEQAVQNASPAVSPVPPPPATGPPAAQVATAEAVPSGPPGSAAAHGIPRLGDASDTAPLLQAPAGAGEEWRLVLRANADAWMQVRARSGQVLLSRTLHPGEVWPVPPEPDLVLSTGNAGGTELVVDGVAAPAIGNSGAVRRDLPLDPDMIRDGKLPAQIKAASSAQPSGVRPAFPQ